MDQRTDNRVQCAGDGEHDGDEVERERECYIELDGAHHALGERDEVRQLLDFVVDERDVRGVRGNVAAHAAPWHHLGIFGLDRYFARLLLTAAGDGLAERVLGWNARLGEKGLRVRVLKGCTRTHRYLVYVYRENRLREVLSDEKVRAFLVQEGYRLPEGSDDCEPLLRQLSRRLCCEAEFPHEIGVFLGYPLTDVVGFIENQGRNFTCCGCWKAYGDRDAAERLFAQLNKCTRVYLRLFHSGTPIFRLAVAA